MLRTSRRLHGYAWFMNRPPALPDKMGGHLGCFARNPVNVSLCAALLLLALQWPASAFGQRSDDRRLAANDPSLPLDLGEVAKSVAFIDIVDDQAGSGLSPPDGGTAFLVSECLLLTAGHVLDGVADDRGPKSIRIRFPALSDPDGGQQALSGKLELRGGNSDWRDPVRDDWAIVRLEAPVPIKPLGVASADCCDWNRFPMMAAVVGFPVDKLEFNRPQAWIDPDCSIIRRLLIAIFATDCQATSGNSGGPLLIRSESGWSAAAILTRAPPPSRSGISANRTGYAIPIAARLRRAIARAAQTPCDAAPINSENPRFLPDAETK